MSEHSTVMTPAKSDVTSADRMVLTVEEAAERLGIGRTLMYALITAGEVESIRIGRLRRVPTDALAAFVLRLRESPHGPKAA
jgi:excisionase family DNA binding protein